MSKVWESTEVATSVCSLKGHELTIVIGDIICVACGLTLAEIKKGKVEGIEGIEEVVKDAIRT